MAIDKKSQHYTSAENYTDLDGNSRSFTFIDHDVKPKLSVPISEEEVAIAKVEFKSARSRVIQQIMKIPASICPSVFIQFTTRGDIGVIGWDEKILKDEGVPFETLVSLKTLLENKIEIEGINIKY